MAGAPSEGRRNKANLLIVAKGPTGRNQESPAYTEAMKYLCPAVLILVAATPVLAQEREVPKDSTRITVEGCTRGRTFIVTAREGHEPTSGDLAPGRRFRLSGSRDILREIEKR